MPESTHPSSVPAPTKRAAFGPALLFFLLWFVATWYFWGDLGKWMDDWNFNMRDPVTGGFKWADVLALDHWRTNFWRPLHIRFASGLQTLLWNDDWAIHLILAVFHAANAWVLWKILVRMLVSRQAAALGALLFLVYPIGHEAIFWMSTLGTGAGLLFFLLCTLAVQRFAVGEVGWRTLVLHLPLLIMAGWWYEQPAACGPAIALAYLAVAPVQIPFRKRLRHSVVFASTAFAAGALYAALFIGLASSAQRGGSGTIVKSDQIVPQATLILTQAWNYATMTRFAPGALQEGWSAFWSRPTQAVIVITLFAIAVVAFGSWWMRAGRGRFATASAAEGACPSNPGAFQRLCAVGFGAAIVAASMVPGMAVFNQWMVPRLMYIPAMGWIIVAAVLVDLVLSREFALSRSAAGRFTRGAVLAALLPALMLGALMLVGVQSVWHKRRIADDHLARQLRERIPQPPSDALILPVSVRDRTIETDSPWFATPHIGPFEAFWSADAFIKFVYRRDDVHSLGFHRWLEQSRAIERLIGAGPDGLTVFGGQFRKSGFQRDAKGNLVVPWDKVIPFRIKRSGRLTLAGSIRVESARNPAEDREIPVTAIRIPNRYRDRAGVVAALKDGDAEVQDLVWTPETAPSPEGAQTPAPESGDSPKPAWAAGRMLSCYTLHPTVPTIPTYSAITTTLSPSASPRRLAWRIGLMDQVWRASPPPSDGFGVTVRLAGRSIPVHRELITPERFRRVRDWISVSVEIPALAEPTKVRIELDAGDASDPSADWCLLTPPVASPLRVPAEGAATAEASPADPQARSPATATADPDTTPPSSPTPP